MTETKIKGKGLAVAGMVIGIIAFIISFFSIGLTLGIIGLILSAIGFVQLNKSNGPRGMVITGLILNILAIGISIYMYYTYVGLIQDGLKNNTENLDQQLKDAEAQWKEALNDLN